VLFWLVVLLATSIYWISPWLQMLDAPQHAAQVQMFLDILHHRYPWQDQMAINWFTPYWLGYALTALFAQAVSVPAALKLCLSLGWLGFVGSGVYLRRATGNPVWWDWLLLPGFFGFAHEWGFVTFLVSVPGALVFLVWARGYTQRPSPRGAWKLVLLGTALFFCHILIQMFSLAIGGTMALLRARSWRDARKRVWPFFASTPIAGLWWFTRLRGEGLARAATVWHLGWHRMAALPVLITGSEVHLLLLAGICALPCLLGARLRRDAADVAGIVILGLILFFLPEEVLGNSYTYQRFAVFVVPMALLAAEPGPVRLKAMRGALGRIAPWLLVAGVVFILGLRFNSTLAFADDVASFGAVIGAMEPNSRVLSLMFDRRNPRSCGAPTYLHFPVWYQCERGGLVDFNFACFYPQIVRYKSNSRPQAGPGFEWSPGRFLDGRFQAGLYRYFVFRAPAPPPGEILARLHCELKPVYRERPWWVYERVLSPKTAVIPPALHAAGVNR
jgi:hypothetical protein